MYVPEVPLDIARTHRGQQPLMGVDETYDKYKELKKTHHPDDVLGPMHRALPSSFGRSRYRPAPCDQRCLIRRLTGYDGGYDAPPFSRSLSLYLHTLPPKVSEELYLFMVKLDPFSFGTNRGLKLVLKEVSRQAKVGGEEFSTYWLFYTDLAVLFGFDDYIPEALVLEDAYGWLGVEKPLKNICPCPFEESFSRGVESFFDLYWRPNPDLFYPDLDEYVALGVWSRGRGSTGPPARVRPQGGSSKRTRRTKAASFLEMDNVGVRRSLCKVVPQRLRVCQKSEQGKVRLIVVGDLDLFLKMDFLSYYVENPLLHSKISTLFMNGSERADHDLEVAERTLYKTWKVPIDQSHFDHIPTLSMINIIFRVMEKKIMASGLPNSVQVREIFSLMRSSIAHPDSRVEVGERHSFRHVHGIPSGWRWTSLLDTIINYAEFQAVREQIAHKFNYDIRYDGLCVQGDDVRVEVFSRSDADLLVWGYNRCGIDVNPGKFFIAQDRDEFLRRMYSRGEIYAYPARAVTSLMWRNPISDVPLSRAETIPIAVSQWFSFVGRGGDPGCVYSHMTADLAQKARGRRIPLGLIFRYIFTPSVVGGLGYVATPSLREFVKHHFGFDPHLIDKWVVFVGANKVGKVELGSRGWVSYLDDARRVTGERIELGEAEKAFREILPIKSRAMELARDAEVRELDVFNPSYHWLRERGPSVRYTPQWSDVPTHPILMGLAKRKILRRGEYRALKRFMTPTSGAEMDVMLSRCDVSVVHMWASEDLPLPSVKYPGASTFWTAKVLRRWTSIGRRILTVRDSGGAALYRAFLGLEYLMRQELLSTVNQLGVRVPCG